MPRECVVVPDLVRFEDLKAGPERWAAVLLKHLARPRNIVAANRMVVQSPFAIENSARALHKLYSKGMCE